SCPPRVGSSPTRPTAVRFGRRLVPRRQSAPEPSLVRPRGERKNGRSQVGTRRRPQRRRRPPRSDLAVTASARSHPKGSSRKRFSSLGSQLFGAGQASPCQAVTYPSYPARYSVPPVFPHGRVIACAELVPTAAKIRGKLNQHVDHLEHDGQQHRGLEYIEKAEAAEFESAECQPESHQDEDDRPGGALQAPHYRHEYQEQGTCAETPRQLSRQPIGRLEPNVANRVGEQ